MTTERKISFGAIRHARNNHPQRVATRAAHTLPLRFDQFRALTLTGVLPAAAVPPCPWQRGGLGMRPHRKDFA